MVGAYKLPVSSDNAKKSINNVDANERTNVPLLSAYELLLRFVYSMCATHNFDDVAVCNIKLYSMEYAMNV